MTIVSESIFFIFCVRMGYLIAGLRPYYRLEWGPSVCHHVRSCYRVSLRTSLQRKFRRKVKPTTVKPSYSAYECLWTEIPCYKYFNLQPPPDTPPQIDSGAISGFDCRYLNPVRAWYVHNPYSKCLKLRMKHCSFSLEAEQSCQSEYRYVLARCIIAPPARRIITS